MGKRGRPSRVGVASHEILRIRITKSEKAELRQAARENNATVSDVVREAVNEYVLDYREGRVFPSVGTQT